MLKKRLPALLMVVFLLPVWTSTGYAGTLASPSAGQILARMAQSIKNKNSVRIGMEIHVATQQSVHLVVKVTADVQDRPRRIMERASTTMVAVGVPQGTPTSQQVHIVVVGNSGALRVGSQPWQCSSVNRLLGSYVDLFRSLNPVVHNAALAGTSMVGGILTWHIHATSRVTVLGQTSSMPIDMFVSQRDYTLVSTSAGMTVKDRAGTIRERVIQRLSHYGERVDVRLPLSCPV